MRERRFADVVENSNYTENRRRINSFAQSLVVEADVAAGNGNFEFLASLGDAVNRLRELPHDVRLFGIAEVQAIGRARRGRTRASHVAGGFSDCVHGTELR